MTKLTGPFLVAAAMCFWTAWLLMPGVGITDAATILKVVSRHPRQVLVSSAVQLLAAALFSSAVPGLARLFSGAKNARMAAATTLLAIGACGVAADAIYHLLAYEMVRPGIDQAAMLPVMQRMQSTDLRLLMPMILAFLIGCVAFALGAAAAHVVPKANPWLYVLALGVGTTYGLVGGSTGVSGRIVGLACLGCLSASVAWIGIALWRQERNSGEQDTRRWAKV